MLAITREKFFLVRSGNWPPAEVVSPSMQGGLGLIVVVLAGLLMCGCGDDSSDGGGSASDAASVVNDYYAALAEQDGDAACALLTEDGQRAAVKVFEGQGDPSYPDVEGLDPGDCPEAISGIRPGANFPDVDSDDVEVSDDGKTAEVSYPDSNVLGLAGDDGSWLLETPIATGR